MIITSPSINMYGLFLFFLYNLQERNRSTVHGKAATSNSPDLTNSRDTSVLTRARRSSSVPCAIAASWDRTTWPSMPDVTWQPRRFLTGNWRSANSRRWQPRIDNNLSKWCPWSSPAHEHLLKNKRHMNWALSGVILQPLPLCAGNDHQCQRHLALQLVTASRKRLSWFDKLGLLWTQNTKRDWLKDSYIKRGVYQLYIILEISFLHVY